MLDTDLAGGDLAERDLGSHVGFVALRRDGGLLAATRDGFVLLDEAGEVVGQHEVDPDPTRRFNDGACTPVGTVLGGTMAYDAEPDAGTVWSFDGHEAHPVLDGVTISNGMAWSSDGHTLYYVDSGWNSVDAFDYHPHPDRLTARRTLVQVPEREGTPDGLAIDAQGCLWVALNGGAQVHRYAPDGALLDRIVVPALQVTSVAFVGPDLQQLAITSATEGIDAATLDAWPRSGALFVTDVAVPGVQPHVFAG